MIDNKFWFIKPEKREEFKRLHFARFRYRFDPIRNRYYREFRKTTRRINLIYVDAETWRIYWDNFGEIRDVPPTTIQKLLNHEMVIRGCAE